MDVTVDVMPSLVITDVKVLPRFGVGRADPKGVVLITPNPAVSVASLVAEVEKTEAADGEAAD